MAKKKPAKGLTRSINFPDDIAEWLNELIKTSCRSFNGEVIYRLRQAKDKDSA